MIYGTPTIVTNGLILNLDAASPKAAPTRNLLYNTNELTNTGAWLMYRSTLTASAAIAPDGTNTAYAWNIDPAGTSALVRLAAVNTNSPISSSVYGGQYTFSVYVKNRNCTATNFELSLYNGPYTIGYEPVYSITSSFTPPITSFAGNTTFSNLVLRSEDVGNGWYRISHTATVTASLNTFNVFFDIEAGGGTKVAGEGIYIWGPQFEVGPVPTPYQPITSTTGSWPSIGSTITGSMVNRPTWVSSNGGSVVFDGVNDYVGFGVIPNLPSGTSDRTMMGWVRDDSIIDYAGDLSPIFGYGSDAAVGQLFRLSIGCVNFNNRKLVIWTNTYNHVSTFSIDRSIWNHIAVTVTPGVTYPRLTIYKNGISDGGSERNINTLNNQPFEIAEVTQNPTYATNFNGRVSQVQAYNRALSQAEILQNYNALKSRFGLS
jgi:hypothetical protein